MLQSTTGNSTIKSWATIFQFICNVEELESKTVESPDIQLSDLLWKIVFRRRQVGANIYVLDICIVAKYVDSSAKWMCEAEAAVRLSNGINRSDKFEKRIVKQRFSHEFPTYFMHDFLHWNEFCDRFVQDRKASFEIELSASPLNLIVPSELTQSYTKMQVALENISRLHENWSPEVVLRGVRWKVHTVKGNDGLGVFLMGVEEDFGLYWSYEVHATIKLISFDRNIEAIEGRFIHVFHCSSHEFGYKKFINWNNLMNEKNEYVKDDTANLVLEIKVEEPKLRLEIENSNIP